MGTVVREQVHIANREIIDSGNRKAFKRGGIPVRLVKMEVLHILKLVKVAVGGKSSGVGQIRHNRVVCIGSGDDLVLNIGDHLSGAIGADGTYLGYYYSEGLLNERITFCHRIGNDAGGTVVGAYLYGSVSVERIALYINRKGCSSVILLRQIRKQLEIGAGSFADVIFAVAVIGVAGNQHGSGKHKNEQQGNDFFECHDNSSCIYCCYYTTILLFCQQNNEKTIYKQSFLWYYIQRR